MVAAAAFEAAFWTCSLRKNSVVNSCWAFAKLAPVLRYIRWICHEENAEMHVSKHYFITIWTQFKTTVFIRKKNNALNLTLCLGDIWNSKCLKGGRNARHMTIAFVHSHSDTQVYLSNSLFRMSETVPSCLSFPIYFHGMAINQWNDNINYSIL